ncbi:hypothetical protein Tco_0213104 [Tanacetum coccineum]
MKETYHVTLSEDDEAISQSSTEEDVINFNENRSFRDDEFLEPKSKVTQCSGYIEYFSYIPAYENITTTDSLILQDSVSPEDPHVFTSADDHPALNDHVHTKSADNLEPAKIQYNVIIEQISRWSREKHIELVNIIGDPLAPEVGSETQKLLQLMNVCNIFCNVLDNIIIFPVLLTPLLLFCCDQIFRCDNMLEAMTIIEKFALCKNEIDVERNNPF